MKNKTYVFRAKKGLGRQVVEQISQMKNEPEWMRDRRLWAYKIFLEKPMPTWGADLSRINFGEIYYYLKPNEKVEQSWDDLPKEIRDTYDKIGIPEAEKKYLGGVKAQYESEVVYGSLKKSLEKKGIIFCGMDEAVVKYPELVSKHFGTVVPAGDNKFASLNSAVWSGGSFVYVPKGVKVGLPLQAYFRINSANMGQFERTLIIVDEGAEVHYVEGCFLAGARVVTIDGLKNIEDVVGGEMVMTHLGRYGKVEKVISRNYSGNVYEIEYFGNPEAKLKVTEEHPILISRRNRNRGRNKEFDLEWVFAKDVKIKDYLVMPIEKVELKTPSSYITKVRLREKLIKVESFLEPDFFRLMGYFFAEGHVDNEHYVTFSFGENEIEYIEDVKRLVKKYFGREVILNKPRQGGVTLVVCSTLYARLLARECGSTVRDKHIPDWLFQSNRENLKELIRGMWFGDGSYDSKKGLFRYNSVSFDLADKYWRILLKLGFVAHKNYQKRLLPRRQMWVVFVVSSDNEKFGKMVGMENVKRGVLAGSPVSRDENYLYLPIRKMSTYFFRGEVYNLSVDEDETYVAEGVISHNCTAPIYSTDSLHAAVVEVIVKRGGKCRYTTIQNWSTNVYNLVTKRAWVEENGLMEWVDGNLGSKVTMKYPCVVLAGEGARGEILSMAVAGKGQNLDNGGKCIHLKPKTTSRIVAKSISLKGGRSSYRGLIQISPGAKGARSKVGCDALILDGRSRSDTYPTNKILESEAILEHEATVSKIGEEQLFYLRSRGFSVKEAEAMIVNGFMEPIVRELPMEYAVELNRLIGLQMEGSVG